jgi:hypothetical protein
VAADDPLDRLYAVPLDEFVSERDRLARELRQAGEREAAARVKALRKPSAVVWALNRLARSDPDAVRGLVEAAERMRNVQRGGRGEDYRDAQRALTEATATLSRRAAGLLAEAGRRPGETLTLRLAAALGAAVASPEASGLLQAGRLTEEPEPAGFAGIGEAAPRARRAPRAGKAPAGRDRAGEERRAAAERRAAERERRRAEEAERRRRVEEAQRMVREAKAEAARLARDLERAQERLARAEEALAKLEGR